MKILFVNSCIRSESRTLRLARYLLGKLEGEIKEINLEEEKIMPLCRASLEKREALAAEGKFDHEIYRYAREFAQSDVIVIAAPYWDLAFPALLKIYMEFVTATGVTFCYSDGLMKGLCKAKQLFYVTTSGGPVFVDFGFSYIRQLAEDFYGIREIHSFRAENLDVEGADVDGLLKAAEEEIDRFFSR